MDKLLSSFAKKYIDTLTSSELIYLCDLLDLDDEYLYKFNQGDKILVKIKHNKVSELFKNFRYSND